MTAQERKEREDRIEKQQEEYSVALIRGFFKVICFVTGLAAVISVIWARWYTFRVCLTILTLALAILVIREWIDLKNEK